MNITAGTAATDPIAAPRSPATSELRGSSEPPGAPGSPSPSPPSASVGGSRAALPAPCPHPRSTAVYGGLLERCDACGLVRTGTDPRFVYDESYFVSDDAKGYDFDSEFARTADEARFAAELARLEAEGLRGRVLDVGCATGSFLVVAKARGWQVAGVEVAEFARREAERRVGEPILASLDDLPAGERFDVVTLHHVLEHIPGPLEFLRDQVRPRVGCRLLVEVPNFASLGSRADGPRWRDLRPEQHLQHFTPETLRRLVVGAGFRVLGVRTLWEPMWSLRSAATTLRWLPHLFLPPCDEPAVEKAPPAQSADVSGWRPPTGARRLATEASRLAFAPLLRHLERRGLAERLALDAEPIPADGRSVEEAARAAAASRTS